MGPNKIQQALLNYCMHFPSTPSTIATACSLPHICERFVQQQPTTMILILFATLYMYGMIQLCMWIGLIMHVPPYKST